MQGTWAAGLAPWAGGPLDRHGSPNRVNDPRPPTPLNYRRIPVRHVLAPQKLQTQRFSTKDAGTPLDIHWGGSNIWFTGGANVIGWIDEGRNVQIHHRTVGAPPRRLANGRHRPDGRYSYDFIDPEAGRMGRVSIYGVEDDPPSPPGLRPLCLGPSHHRQHDLLATDGGHLIGLERGEKFTVPETRITALGRGPEWMIWYFCESKLYWFHPESGLSRPSVTPEPIYADELVHGPGVYPTLAYLDRTRNIIGWLREPDHRGYVQLEEMELPLGLEPRALTLGVESLWFSGRGGASLFRLDHMSTAYEYPCADAQSDLARLSYGSREIWFTEPAHGAIGRASTVGL